MPHHASDVHVFWYQSPIKKDESSDLKLMNLNAVCEVIYSPRP